MKIRPYSAQDREACMDILDGNTPEFFVPDDRQALAAFLADLPGPYLVVEAPGGILACGGWAIDSNGVADLTWGMVRRGFQRGGIGRMLLRHRIACVRAQTSASRARVRTTQLVQGFFAREGFSVVEIVAQGFGPRLDRVTMDFLLRVRDP